jgi:hypothetical protein
VKLSLLQNCSSLSIRFQFKSFSTNIFFTGWGYQPHAQIPTWRTSGSLFVWVITFDLSGIGDSNSSYATASTALRTL